MKKKRSSKLRQEVKVKVDIVTSDAIKIYYTGKFMDFTGRYIMNQSFPGDSFQCGCMCWILTYFLVLIQNELGVICDWSNHTDQREPRTPYVLNTPDQIFHGRNAGGVFSFFMDLINLDRNVDLQQCQAE